MIVFNEEEWETQLRKLNSWANSCCISEADPEFVAARRDESIRRWEVLGRPAWNRWAKQIVRLQEQAEIAGLWATTEAIDSIIGTNEGTRLHLHLSQSDFRRHWFCRAQNFSDALFPGAARFDNAALNTQASPGSYINFSSAIFKGPVSFSEAIFNGPTLFSRATFESDARFDGCAMEGRSTFLGATFKKAASFSDCYFRDTCSFSGASIAGIANFQRATFDGSLSFENAKLEHAMFAASTFKKVSFDRAIFARAAGFETAMFGKDASFRAATFQWGALFTSAKFREAADFKGAQFIPTRSWGSMREADFTQATFDGSANFSAARFVAHAIFESIESSKAFSISKAHFDATPDFIGAVFHVAPRLDESYLIPPISESHIFNVVNDLEDGSYPRDPRPAGILRMFALSRDRHEHARLRKLRTMATDGEDYENGVLFNAYEIAARRFWVDKPLSLRFWLSWLYGLFSDYGQSIGRPLIALGALTALFWAIFLFSTTQWRELGMGTRCHSTYLTQKQANSASHGIVDRPSVQSLALAIRNGSLFGHADPTTSRRIYGCLYGMSGNSETSVPEVPQAVFFLSAVQSVVSAVLLFLIALGARNMFRMK